MRNFVPFKSWFKVLSHKLRFIEKRPGDEIEERRKVERSSRKD
jgi:hypothetical protein